MSTHVPSSTQPFEVVGRPSGKDAADSSVRSSDIPKRYSSTQAYRPLRRPTTVEDQDACALYAAVRRDGKPSHQLIQNGFAALQKMLHRAGNVDGEGDGCGVLIDIPRTIWQSRFARVAMLPS